jgi:hypothetical protein
LCFKFYSLKLSLIKFSQLHFTALDFIYMEKNLPSANNGNTNGWKKKNSISFKKLSLTCFVSAFVFLMAFVPRSSFAGNFSGGPWTSVTTSNSCAGTLSNYTLIANTENSTGADIPAGKAVVITFPSGFTLSSITGGTFQGTAMGTINKTATTVSFNVPSGVSVAKKTQFTIVLNGITNSSTAGNYQLSMTIDNSTGTGTGSQDIFAASTLSQFTINPNATITLSSGSATPTVCVNSAMTNTVYAIANATGASIPAGSLPTGVSGIFNATTKTYTISGSPSVTGTFPYTVTTSGSSCTNASTGGTITVKPLPTATISGTTAVCQNSATPNITFTGANGTPPYTFTFNINSGTSQTVTTTSGNTSVTVSAPTGTAGTFIYNLLSVAGTFCSQTQTGSATVTVNPLPTATISGTTAVCQSSTSPNITFTGANGTAPYTFTYTINGGANQTVTTTSGNSATVSQPTGTPGTFTYALVSVAGANCSQTQTGSAIITVRPLPTATISGTTAVCQNSTSPDITFTGANGTPPYTFSYNINGGATQTVTTPTGATSITVSAQTGTATTLTYNLLSVAGTFCSQPQTGSAVITVNPSPTATISGTTAVCQNSTSPNITFAGASGTAPYTFTYNIDGGANQTVTTPTGSTSVTVSAPTGTTGTFTYNLVSVSGAKNCSQAQTGSAVITVNPLPTATISGTAAVCQNASAPVITFTGANGTAPYTFTYTISGGANQTVTTTSGNSVTVSQPTGTTGTFTYALVSVSGAKNCSQSQSGSAIITVNPLPTATISGTTAVCQGGSTPDITFTGANGTAPYTFTYTINAGVNQTVTTTSGNSVTVSQPTGATGTFTYTLVSVSGAKNCTNPQSGSAVITVNPLPTATISGTTPVCQGSSSPDVTFTGAGGTAPYTFTYTINSGANQTVTTTSGNSVTVSAPTSTTGTFTYDLVSVSGAKNCSNPQSGTATITVNPVPTAAISGTATVCQSSGTPNITFTGANGTAPYTFTYKINGGANQTVTTTSGNTVTVDAPTGTPGTFTYTLVNVAGANCSQAQSGSATITITALPQGSLSGNGPLCSNGTASLTFTSTAGTGPFTVVYNDGNANLTQNNVTSGTAFDAADNPITATTTYTLVSVTDDNGCARTSGFTSGSTTITVSQAPAITGQPQNQAVCGTKPVSFIVTATGDGLTYQWYKNGTELSNTRIISGVTTNTLHYTQANFADSNSVFTVRVSGTAPCSSVTSAGATLSVDQKIIITQQPSDTTVCSGSDITFTVTATSSDPLTYQWRKNGGNISGATDPAYTITGVKSSDAADYDVVISGTPSNFSCPDVTSAPATLTVNTSSTISLSSAPETTSQIVCINNSITNITYNISGSGTGATITGLPAGVGGNYSSTTNIFTISGKPTESGSFNYTVTTKGPCNNPSLSGTITVNPNSTITLTSGFGTNTQTTCAGTAITDITYDVTGATGATITGLPSSLTGSYSSGVVTISGTPTASGTINYTVTPTGGCGNASATGTITVSPNTTITRTSAAATTTQSVCINTALTDITYSVGVGGTGAGVTGLPAGVSGNFAGGTFTISGTPTESGTFNYAVTTTGGCGTATATGTITVNPNATITRTSAAATTTQSVCINTAITDITYSVGAGGTGAGATGLPAGVTSNFAGGTFTISGTPTVSGTFNYTVTTTGGCGAATATGTITVNPNATITRTSAAATTTQSVCINTAITDITYSVGAGGTGAGVTGLPAGVTSNFAGGTFTISGTPTANGTFNYTVTTTGGCGSATAIGTITVNPNATITRTSAAATTTQSVCINTALTDITYSVGAGGTGAGVTGLPAGVTSNFAGGTFTISGTPTVSGTFNYTVTTTGGCGTATATGTITVNPNATITRTSAAATTTQSVCINTAITDITYSVGAGGTGAGATGLPAGVTSNFAGGTFTISGTPTVSGTFNYTVTTTGGCGAATATGTITVNPNATITRTSAAATTTQSVCINTAITDITYSVGAGGTGAGATGLPAGVTSNFAGGTFTISGTPTASGNFNYTVTTTGGCGAATATGTITVNPNATITLSSAQGTDAQTVCLNGTITDIKYTIGGGATGASITAGALPAGVTGSYNSGTFTISGTPTASGVYSYTVTATGGCASPTSSGSIRVNAPFTPTITASPSDSICSGQSAILTASGYNSIDTIPGGDFGQNNPSGWIGQNGNSSNDNASSPFTWGYTNNPKVINGITYSHGGSFMVVSGAVNSNLSTPIFSSIGRTSLVLQWNQGYNFNSGTTAKVEISTNGGSTYTTLVTYSGVSNETPTNPFTTIKTIDLSAYLEKSNLRIRFNYSGSTNSTWAIDNVNVIGNYLPISYAWASGQTTQSITVSPTATTTYSVRSSTTSSCAPTTATKQIVVRPLPTATIGTDVTVCQNDPSRTITFTGTNGTAPYTFTYNITANGTTGSNQTVKSASGTNPQTATVTQLTGTSGTFKYNLVSVQGQFCSNNTATATGSATITVNPLPTVAAITGTTTVCVNSTTTLSDAITGGTWSSGNTAVATINSTTGVVTGVTAGTATITYTVTNSNNCTNSTSATATVNALPTVAAITGTTTVCVNSTTTLSDATTGGTWSSGNTAVATVNSATGVVTGVTAGTASITYTVTNTNSCTNSTSATVTVNALPTVAAITGTTTVCVNSTTTLSDATTGGTWSSGNTAVATVNSTTGVVTGVAAGSATITYTYSNGTCSNTATTIVTVNALPTVAPVTGTTTVCAGSTTTLSDATTGGTWISSNTAVATVSTSGVVSGVASGSATITYTVTNSNNCTNSSAATVTVSALPTVEAISGTTNVCVGNTTTLNDATTGGTWSSGNTVIATVNSTGIVTGVAAGTATITYTVTNGNNCTSSSTATVTVNPTPAPTITAQGPTTSCVGAVKLTSNSATGNQWYKNGTQIALLATSQEYTALDSGSYTVMVTNSFGCSATSAAVVVSFVTNSWIAKVDNNWNTGANWCSGTAPTSSTNAIIPSGLPLSKYPMLSADAQVKNLDIQSGAEVLLNGNSLTINGTLTGTNKFVGSDKSGLVLNGTSSSTLNFDNVDDSSSNALSDLTINTTGTVTLGSRLYITGTLASNAGTLNTGDHLTIRSTSIAATARVAPVSGNITGDVTVERFILARRASRFISSAVTTEFSSKKTIKDNWMEGAVNGSINPPFNNPHPGYGTNITGRNPEANGFDPTKTTNPSIYTYTTKWDTVRNSFGTLSAGDAYRLTVRGDRSTDMRTNNPTVTNTILRTTGTLFTKDYSPTLNTGTNAYTFIGNPYASPVDFEKMIAYDKSADKVTGTANDIKPEYTAFDPQLSTRGAYVTYNAVTQTTSNLTGEASKVDKNIQSGQAVFVQTSGSSPLIRFKESYKTTGNTRVFRNPSALTKLFVQLLLNKEGGLENNADGVVAFFDNDFSTVIGNEDSYKFTNEDENLAINHQGISLSMEGRPSVTADDTVALKMWQFRRQSYYLRLTGSNFSPEVTAFVKDNYLHTESPVDLSSVTLLPFNINTDSASFATNRFSIVFKLGKALPVTLTKIKAYQKDNGIQVDWTAENEVNIGSYEVEKSVDGQHFAKGTGITAKGNNSVTQNYSWLDENAVTGSNFYRIKVIEKSGEVKYSNIVKVDIAYAKGTITVFPNPIKGSVIQVKLSNMEKGRYSAVLYNTLGQKLYSNTIEHTLRSGNYTISLGRLISKGTYTLHIFKGDISMNERVIVE